MRISGGTAQRKRIKRCIDRSIVIMTCARILQSNNLYWMSATIAAAGAGWKQLSSAIMWAIRRSPLTVTPSTVGSTFSLAACFDFSMNSSAFGFACLGFFS